jgi:hypothetical protein
LFDRESDKAKHIEIDAVGNEPTVIPVVEKVFRRSANSK